MKQRPRIYYSDAQKALMLERWRQGATLRWHPASRAKALESGADAC